MSTLLWSDSLVLGLPFMDDTHEEFVHLLAQVVASNDTELLAKWRTLIERTDVHFGQEDHWMKSTRFSSSNCHTMQHKVILQVMREGEARGQSGELGVVRKMAHELGLWFSQHVQSMDAALALHLRSAGFDAATGWVHAPESLPQEETYGCGGATCASPAPRAMTMAAPLAA